MSDSYALYNQKMEDVGDFYSDGDYQKVIKICTEVIKSNGYINDEVYYWRGKSYFELEDYSKALQDFEKALIYDPKDSYNHYYAGLTQIELKNYSAAIDHFNQAIYFKNDLDAEFYYKRGIAYMNLQNYSKALQDLKDALTIAAAENKDEGYYYVDIGICYKKLGDDEKSDKYLAIGCRKNGDFFARHGAHKEAQEWYSRAEKYEGGCFITTAVCDYYGKADNCAELTTLRNFRDNWLTLQADGKTLIKEYYKIAPQIVRAMKISSNYDEICRTLFHNYINPCVELINDKKFVECKNLYIKMVNYAKAISKK